MSNITNSSIFFIEWKMPKASCTFICSMIQSPMLPSDFVLQFVINLLLCFCFSCFWNCELILIFHFQSQQNSAAGSLLSPPQDTLEDILPHQRHAPTHACIRSQTLTHLFHTHWVDTLTPLQSKNNITYTMSHPGLEPQSSRLQTAI